MLFEVKILNFLLKVNERKHVMTAQRFKFNFPRE